MAGNKSKEAKIPVTIGRYKVQSILGKGGMSTVYACLDPRIEREVAVKVLPHALLHDLMFRKRFEREAKMIASLEHPYIVPVHDFGEDNGQPYLVMRLMRGKSLEDRLANGPIPTAEIEPILSRVNGALAAAHERGIIHRDLKPGNILFDEYNNAFLSDFGIARFSTGTQASITKTGGAVGTPGYMSPEQIQGRPVDGRSDIYALGILLFEMLTGQKPFHADTPAMIIVRQMTEPLPAISDVHPELPSVFDELIHLLTAPDRDDRPATTTDVTNLLKAIIDDVSGGPVNETAAAPDPTPPPEPAPKQKEHSRPSDSSASEQSKQPETEISELPFFNMAPPIIPKRNQPATGNPAGKTDAAETAVHARTTCPHCFTPIDIDEPTNTVTCPHCDQSLPLAGHLCPYCEAYHEIEAGFCESCGAAMTRICPQCDAINWAGVERCQTCGASLDIFDSLRLHDQRVAAERRQDRLEEIRYFKQIEAEASQRRMSELRGDPEALRRKAKRQRLLRSILTILILITLAALAYIIYNNVTF